MGEIDLLVVGPVDRATGGITRFVAEQCERLPTEFDVSTYDDGTNHANGSDAMIRGVLVSLWAMVWFPFRVRPDVVHVHTSHGLSFYRATWYVLVAAILWRRPVVVHVHGSGFEPFVRSDARVPRAFQWAAFGAASRVIVLSPYWRDVLSARVPDRKLLVVPNAVDADAYRPTFGGDPPRVAFISNLIERKGVRELVAAIDRVDPAAVTIAGDGPLSHMVEDLAERRSGVDYRGYVSEAEKRSILESADVYVLPTYAEGLPIALLEGMAGGNAVVTTDVGAIPELVDEEGGRIVESGDADALSAALSDLLGARETVERMGRHNRTRVIDAYSWPATTEKLAATYRALVREEEVGENVESTAEPRIDG